MTFAKSDGVSTGIPSPGSGAVAMLGRDCSPFVGLFHRRAYGTLRLYDGVRRGLDPVLAVPLGLVEGSIRGREELGGTARRGRRRHAEARGDWDGVALRREDDPPGEGRADPLRHLRTTAQIGPREDEEELLPAPASREVDAAEGCLEHGRELTQDGVAGRMPVAVVDVLEPVEVGDDERERPAEAF